MAYPDLYKDEHKILETQNIKVKSVSFNAVLTNRRLVLIDGKKRMLPPQEILLATLKNVDSGENAIRDPTLTLSIMTNTGTTRQMILTFSQMAGGGERKRECDEWVKALRQFVSTTIEHPVLPDIPTLDEAVAPPVTESTPIPPSPPRIEIVNTPQQKKRIEISRPMKKIVESAPAMPAPVETTTLPTGSFCNRCGSRVPPESAFCNRCGTPVVKESDLEATLAQQPAPPVTPQPPAPEPSAPPAPEAPLPAAVPQVAVPVPPVFGQAQDKKERPLEDVIHSIEPLIEDSVPRTEPAPLVPRSASLQALETAGAEPEKSGEAVKWPVITPSAPVSGTAPVSSDTPAPPVPSSQRGGGRRLITLAVIGIVILAIVAGVFLFANPLAKNNGGADAPTPVPTVATMPSTTVQVTTEPHQPATTTVTLAFTTAPTMPPASAVPATGVWVRVSYVNQFSGTVGTPNALRDVSEMGEKLYQISTSTGTVSAIIQKDDGSGDPLTVEVYKNGELVTKKSTTAPKGVVEIQVNLKPAPTPTPTTIVTTVVPTATTASVDNTTATATPGS